MFQQKYHVIYKNVSNFSLFVCTLSFSCLLANTAFSLPNLVWKKAISNDKLICLTFDDGPNPEPTKKVLQTLSKYQIKGTFFLIGRNVERFPDLAKRIVEEGHVVGNHSYTVGHFLAFKSLKGIKRDLTKTNQIILSSTGVVPKYFRPPNGLMTATMDQVCRELKLTPVGVNVFVFDNLLNNPTSIAKKVMKQVKGGPLIIVLHDGFGESFNPSRSIISQTLEIIIVPAHIDIVFLPKLTLCRI